MADHFIRNLILLLAGVISIFIVFFAIMTIDSIASTKEIYKDSNCDHIQERYDLWKGVNDVKIIPTMWVEELAFGQILEERC